MGKNFLQNGELTETTDQILHVVNSFNSEGLDFVQDILKYLKTFQENRNVPNKHTNIRTADQTIQDKLLTGCTDYALVFIALMRAKGIPAKYIETIERGWLESQETGVFKGHVISEVSIKGKWYLVDPSTGELLDYFPKYLVIYDIGLDTLDIGLTSSETLRDKFIEFRARWQKQNLDA